MTLKEFEAWVSDHYEDLAGIASTVSRNDPAGVDLLHNLIESVCDGSIPVPEAISTGWFATRVHGMARNHRGSDRRTYGRVLARLTDEISTVGPEDAYLDLTRAKKASRDRRKKLKSASISHAYLEESAACSVGGGIWYGNPGGTARWRYQQLRDDRLFAARAIRSQADSIWAAAKRQTHGIERGNSYTEFGLEVSK